MKKPLLSRKAATIIVLTVMVIFIGLVIMQFIRTKELDVSLLIPIGLGASALGKLYAGNKTVRIKDSAAYESAYKNNIRHAFIEEGREKYKKILLKGIMYSSNGNLDEAKKTFLSLLPFCQTQDDYRATYFFLARTYAKSGFTDAAIDTYYEVIKADNEYSTAWSNLGLLYQQKGKYNDALGCYFNAIKYDNRNAYAHNNIAQACNYLGYYRQAIEHGEIAYEIDPGVYQSASALAIAYSAIGEAERADKYYKIYAMKTQDADNLRNLMNYVAEGGTIIPEEANITPQIKRATSIFAKENSVTCASLCLYEEESNTKSYFGGASLGEAPLDDDGKPMAMLCSLYCSELNGVQDFPETGILRFYVKDDESYGATPNKFTTTQSTFKVLYTPDEHSLVEEKSFSVSEKFPIQKKHQITPILQNWILSSSDYRFRSTLNKYLTENNAQALEEMNEITAMLVCNNYVGDGHKAGGYPLFAEKDIRENNESLRRYDTLLLQIDTHSGKISIGENGGSIKFFIPGENLKNKNFNDILYTWDD